MLGKDYQSKVDENSKEKEEQYFQTSADGGNIEVMNILTNVNQFKNADASLFLGKHVQNSEDTEMRWCVATSFKIAADKINVFICKNGE